MGVCIDKSTILFNQCANMVWKMKGTKGPLFSISCSFYKQKIVSDVATSTSNLYFYFEACYYCRWRFFKSVCSFMCSSPPFLLNLMFFSKWGEGGFRVLDSPSSLLSLEKKLFVRTWVLASCIFFCPFVGCFVLLMIDKFSSNLRDFCTIWIVQSCVCIKNGTKPP